MENMTLQELESLSAQQLRELAAQAHPGRTADIRKVSKYGLAQMLYFKYSLEHAMQEYPTGAGRRDEKPVPIPAADKEMDEAMRQAKAMSENMPASLKPAPAPAPAPKVEATDEAGRVLAQLIGQHLKIKNEVDPEQLAGLVRDEVGKQIVEHKKVHLSVVTPSGTRDVGRQHFQFETLLTILATRTNVLLVGPAGSGKTTAAEKCAEALGLPFYAISVGPQTSKTDLMGYMDASGKYVTTNFRRAYEDGGVMIIDEMDAGNAGVLTIINAATSNGMAGFPDGMAKRHPDFVLIAAANTYGRGADRQYVGRNQLDAATLDRFVTLDWSYDEKLERDLAGNDSWTNLVQAVRKEITARSLRHVVSPRASITGARLLAAGMLKQQVIEMVLMKGADAATIALVNEVAGRVK